MIRTAVVGATGYTGTELVGLLAGHPEARVESLVGARSAGRKWADVAGAGAHLYDGTIEEFDSARLSDLDAVFLALPHGESASAAAELVGKVPCVVDLSGDLRLPDAATYERWYGRTHPAPELLGTAAYALPELFGDSLPGAGLISCPGCYPTVTQLAAAPVLTLLENASAVSVSAVSGTSGAGRSAGADLSFSEMHGEVRSYRVGHHQHTPEMAMGLGRAAGREIAVTFVPHLAPLERGIHATITVADPVGTDPTLLLGHYREFYDGAPFVRVLDPADRLPSTRSVAHTNLCEIAPVVEPSGGSIVIVAAIDNLVKGAAGQAVQAMNLRFGLDETAGLGMGGAA